MKVFFLQSKNHDERTIGKIYGTKENDFLKVSVIVRFLIHRTD
jgi:hypothetical protein